MKTRTILLLLQASSVIYGKRLQLQSLNHSKPMVGGWSVTEVNDTSTSVLYEALGDLANYAQGLGPVCVHTVHSIEQQVVAGIKYKFHMTGHALNLQSPDQLTIDLVQTCDKSQALSQFDVVIWVQSWMKSIQIVSITRIDTADGAKATKPSEVLLEDLETKHMIDAWLKQHEDTLNPFGDKMGTMYTGGTPLFNERTGKSIDRYQYIINQHSPDQPWTRPTSSPSSWSSVLMSGFIVGLLVVLGSLVYYTFFNGHNRLISAGKYRPVQ